jgi:DNA-binding transcriptional MerR regulator
MGEETSHGQSRPEFADLASESGWVTTDVAAKAVRVSPRTIRRYIDQGKLEAKPEGEGVRREWLVSVDSLHALRATQTFEEQSPRADRASHAGFPADSIADVLREMAARLERRAEEAAELRVRLEITERAQSTLEAELAEANRRREEAERGLEELRRQLEEREEAPESPESPVPSDTPPDAGGEVQEATERQEERRGWFRRFFGI